MEAILGEGVRGLSPANIVRLKQIWEQEYLSWSKRDLSASRYVYLLADAIVRHEAPENRVGCKDPPAGCRSSPLKLEAAGTRKRRERWEQPRQRQSGGAPPDTSASSKQDGRVQPEVKQ